MSEKTVRIVIEGRVQGVWFRGWVAEQAAARNLDGWVRNRTDGRVEALFSGPGADVEAIIRVCHQGPPMARVDHVGEHPAEPPEEAGFRHLPTI